MIRNINFRFLFCFVIKYHCKPLAFVRTNVHIRFGLQSHRLVIYNEKIIIIYLFFSKKKKNSQQKK